LKNQIDFIFYLRCRQSRVNGGRG